MALHFVRSLHYRRFLQARWLALGLLCTSAMAQAPTMMACPTALQVQAPQLHGLWSVQFVNPPRGLPAEASLLLERHAEFSESLAGVISRDLSSAPAGQVAGHASKAFLAGDLEEGVVTLDESSNGSNLTGTWNGAMVDNSCGKQIKGVWQDTSSSAPPDAPTVPFTLTRRASW